MKKNIILMGPPGAGKGTLATELKDTLKLPHISTGDMFREAIANKTELGNLASSYIKQGELVPDEVTIGLVKERLSKPDCDNGFLLDGFPRTKVQAEALEKLSKEINRTIDVVINLSCSQDELIERICGRRVCPQCGAPYHIKSHPSKVEGVCDVCGAQLIQRPDDNIDSFKVRLKHYELDTKPLLDFYQEKGLLATFDANRGIKLILDDVSRYLGL